MKKSLLALCVLAILAIATGIYVWIRDDAELAGKPQPAKTTGTTPATQSGSFNKQQFSTSDPNSLWVIVNKKHALPKGFAPANLVIPDVPLRLTPQSEQMHVSSVMAPALQKLVNGAKNDGIDLKLSSGYRSEALQKQFFDSYAARDGVQAAATYSAYPGTSEHQTGLAADMMAANDECSLQICFADTPEGKWLAAHAHEYGFIIRYLNGKEAVTTYQYEPWHIRYVDVNLANQLYTNGLTMEEYFGYS